MKAPASILCKHACKQGENSEFLEAEVKKLQNAC